ncbi:MAG: Para-hydroxybenzoate--polyprenyltransferase, mitochondrial precursor (PHB:polyprenyltransferase) [Trichoglossum hirsutum]|jgi:4-hydroxybenzoate polyprenyltransferase|nr:MAG: Para-hydroxybenzoate--polyprenyltransferase, mitochondrial precursor (PHB:polyprenyltransferase) [Trichoglossum hirsutum]
MDLQSRTGPRLRSHPNHTAGIGPDSTLDGKAKDYGPPSFSQPTEGVLSVLPASWVPYAQLMRIEKPGLIAFYIPHLIGLSYAACAASDVVLPSVVLRKAGLFLLGSIFLRGAAVSWNDNIDQDFDRKVERCRLRPIARGAVSTTQGHVFTFALTLIGGILLLQLPIQCAYDAVPIALLWGIYPFAKRFTDYTPLILGFPFASSIFIGSHAIEVDPLTSSTFLPTICLFTANVLWTTIYETIYAHQDIKDDAKAGVKSMALRFSNGTKVLTSVLAVAVVSLLLTLGVLMEMSLVYVIATCGGTAVSLAAMIGLVDLSSPASCAWWFKLDFWLVGGSMVCGLLGEYYRRLL